MTTASIRRALSPAVVVRAVFAVVVAMLFVEVARWIAVPVFLDNTEIYLGYGIRSLAAEGVLYRDLSRLPLVVHVYQPLAYLPGALLLDVPALGSLGMLPTARLPNLPFLAVMLAALCAVARRLSGSREVALLAAVASVYLHAAFFPEILRVRPENGAMACTLVALLLALARPRGWEIGAAFAIATANFFKPTFVALPAAVFLRLLVERRPRRALLFAASCAGAFAAMATAAWAAFGPDYLVQTLRFSAANPDLPLWKAPVLLLVWARLFGPALALLAVGCVAILRRDGATGFLPLYLLLAIATAVPALAKTGADIHYLLELSFVALFCFVASLPERGRVALAAALCAVAVGYHGLRTGTVAVRFCAHRHAGYLACDYTSPLPVVPAAAREAAVADPASVVLDEVLAFETGKVVALDWTLLDLLVRGGFVDPRPLLDLLRAPTTTRIVFPRRTTPLLDQLHADALRDGMREVDGSDGRVLERPAATPPGPVSSSSAAASGATAATALPAANRIPKQLPLL